jgi:putative nucleotidyltransferase with HDIG domain
MEGSSSAALRLPSNTLPRWNVAHIGRVARRLVRGNAEIWVILSLFLLGGLLTLVPGSRRSVLSLYALPTIVSAYRYGRRHATLTALGSVLLVVLLTQFDPDFASSVPVFGDALGGWLEVVAWGGSLILTAYLMGTLYEHRNEQLAELRETYHGVLMILRHFVAKDGYTENHSYRVSLYASRIAAEMGLADSDIEDIRAAALLHDIGKLRVSRELLHKAALLSEEEVREVRSHVGHGAELLEPTRGALRRVLPIVLAHHDRFDGTGYRSAAGEGIPIGARIIATADVYDAMVSDRPYRKAVTPIEAKEIIERGSGTEFDPSVVESFVRAFRRGQMDLGPVVV